MNPVLDMYINWLKTMSASLETEIADSSQKLKAAKAPVDIPFDCNLATLVGNGVMSFASIHETSYFVDPDPEIVAMSNDMIRQKLMPADEKPVKMFGRPNVTRGPETAIKFMGQNGWTVNPGDKSVQWFDATEADTLFRQNCLSK